MHEVNSWFTAHWAVVDKDHPGVFLHKQKDWSRKKTKETAQELQGNIKRGDLVYYFETKNNPEDQTLNGAGSNKVVVLGRVIGNKQDIKIGENGWVHLWNTRGIADIDCPAVKAREITGIGSLGGIAPLNFGTGNVKKIEKDRAFRLMKYVIDPDIYSELLARYFSDDLEDGLYQKSIETAEPASPHAGPRGVEYEEIKGGKRVKRNSRIAKRRLEMANYKCEINSGHNTFISSLTGKNYMEVHHLIPTRISIQKCFGNNSLDHEANIFSVCPNCHRLLHHAAIGEKKALIKQLFEMRRMQLRAAGLDLTMRKLISYYL